MLFLLPLVALASSLTSGCGGSPDPTLGPMTPNGSGAVGTATVPSIHKVRVVATTAILADLVQNVGGDRIEVHTIVPPGADIHSFRTTPGDSVAVSQAALVVSNGFGLDDFLEPVLASATRDLAVRVVATEGLQAGPAIQPGLPLEGSDQEAAIQGGNQEGHGAALAKGDPHLWQNPLYAVHYVQRIREGLIRADPTGADYYRGKAETYIQQLRDLDREIAQILGQVPPQRRHLVTFHDAFGYFAERYGWEVSAFVAGDASEVTPGAVVTIMKRIKEGGIAAVFAEPQFGAGVLGQAAADAGVDVGVIYSDALNAVVPTYVDMMRFNAESLVEHVR